MAELTVASTRSTREQRNPGRAGSWIPARLMAPAPLRGTTILSLLLLAIIILSTFLVQVGIHHRNLEARREQELQANLELARSLSSIFENYLQDILLQEMAIGLAISSRPYPYPGQTDPMLANLAGAYPSVRDFCWLDPEGKVATSSSPANLGDDLSSHGYFRTITGGAETSVSDLRTGHASGLPAFEVARGIRDRDGSLLGIVAAEIVPSELGLLFQRPREKRGEVAIYDQQGTVVHSQVHGEASAPSCPNSPLLDRALAGEEAVGAQADCYGQPTMAAYVPIQPVGWVISATRPEAEAMEPALRDFARDLLILLTVSLGACGLVIILGRGITVPMGRLRRRALEIARGQLEGSVELDGPSEVVELAEAFNRMSREVLIREEERNRLLDELRDRNQELILASDRNRALAESADRSAERLRAIQQVMEVTLSHLVLDDLLGDLLDRLRLLLKGDIVSLLLVDETTGDLVVRAASGTDAAGRKGVRVPMGLGISGRIAQARQPMIFEDMSQVEVFTPSFRERVNSVMGAPLMIDDQVIGVVHVGTTQRKSFTQEELQLLRLVADRVALGVERARLYEAELEARAAAEQQAAELNALLEKLGEAVTIAGGDGSILLRNQMARDISGLSDDELRTLAASGQPNVLSLEGLVLPFAKWPLQRAIAGEIFRDEEVLLARPDGSQRRILVSGSSIRNGQGKVSRAIIVFRDVTELRELEQTREEYTSMISHDLRAPLSVVLGRAMMIQRYAQSPEKVLASAASIVTSARRMDSMIQDLVESSRLEAGAVKLDLQPLDLPFAIEELKERMAGSLESHRIKLLVGDPLPPVMADPNKLERILTNLITNALKYSEPGSPVTLQCVATGEMVKTTVSDLGQGIPPEELPHLFQRYHRSRTSRKQEGLGLGLYITRMLVESHGGRIWAESTLGQGSSFNFTLRIAPAAQS